MRSRGFAIYTTPTVPISELPTPAQLRRSAVMAIFVAAILAVVAVLPAEYGLDLTGLGKPLGLTEMGEIKQSLAEEAAHDKDHHVQAAAAGAGVASASSDSSASSAQGVANSSTDSSAQPTWRDETRLSLKPGEGTEIKLRMNQGDKAQFAWRVEGGAVNFDLHGSGSGQSISYEKGSAAPAAQGELTAAFSGSHGWFWRNRGKEPVVVVLKTSGSYSEVRR